MRLHSPRKSYKCGNVYITRLFTVACALLFCHSISLFPFDSDSVSSIPCLFCWKLSRKRERKIDQKHVHCSLYIVVLLHGALSRILKTKAKRKRLVHHSRITFPWKVFFFFSQFNSKTISIGLNNLKLFLVNWLHFAKLVIARWQPKSFLNE